MHGKGFPFPPDPTDRHLVDRPPYGWRHLVNRTVVRFLTRRDEMTAAKKSQPWVYNFSTLESEWQAVDQKSVAFWVAAAEAFRETVEVSEVPVTLSAWAAAWQKQFPKRSATTVRIYVGRINMLVARGYDVSTFESMEHVAEAIASKKSPVKKSTPTVRAKKMVKENRAAAIALARAILKEAGVSA